MEKKKVFVTRASMPAYEDYVKAIKPLWDSSWITNMGEYHQELEVELEKFLDVPYVSLMVNGHMALELVIQAMDFPEGSEVITTPFTFISTTHAIVRNHLKPIFCDVKECDGTIDESKIEDLITEKTVAILPVHVYGNICNVKEIQRIADKYCLKVIYDAAHAFAEKVGGKGIGNYGDASVFSFHATKVFNTIEGGAVTFSEPALYGKLYNLKNFGIRGEELIVEVGVNAKMNEFQAIMGICNLKYLPRTISERKVRYDFYKEYLGGTEGIRFFERNEKACNNYAYLPILIEDAYGSSRDELYLRLREHGVYARKYFYPLTNGFACYKGRFDAGMTPIAWKISQQVCFKNIYRGAALNQSRSISRQVMVLPLYEDLELESIKKIIHIIKRK